MERAASPGWPPHFHERVAGAQSAAAATAAHLLLGAAGWWCRGSPRMRRAAASHAAPGKGGGRVHGTWGERRGAAGAAGRSGRGQLPAAWRGVQRPRAAGCCRSPPRQRDTPGRGHVQGALTRAGGPRSAGPASPLTLHIAPATGLTCPTTRSSPFSAAASSLFAADQLQPSTTLNVALRAMAGRAGRPGAGAAERSWALQGHCQKASLASLRLLRERWV